MTLLQLMLLIAVVLVGWPVGKFIASKTREELQAGRRWFKIIMLTSFIGIIISLLLSKGDRMVLLTASFVFIFLLTLASFLYKKRK